MMKRWLLLLALILLTTGAMAVQAQGGGAPLVLTNQTNRYPLGTHVEILEDPTGQLTIDQVTSPELAAAWAPSTESIPNFGFTSSAYWVRLGLRNESPERDWRLLVDQNRLVYVDLYAPSSDGVSTRVVNTGMLRPFSTRDVPDTDLIFAVPLPQGEDQTIYLRVKSNSSVFLPLSLWPANRLAERQESEQLLWGILYGILAAMAVYNFFLFISLHDRAYLYLVGFIAAFSLLSLSTDGRGSHYLWPSHLEARAIITVLGLGLTMAFLLLFSMAFLQTKTRTPRLHKVLTALLALALAGLFLLPIDHGRVTAMLEIVFAILGVICIMAAGLVTWRQGYHPARYFVIGQAAPYLLGIVAMVALLGLGPQLPQHNLTSLMGATVLVLMLSIALADRIKVLQADIERASKSASANERRLSEYLEAIPLGITVYDTGMRQVYINKNAFRTARIPSPGPLRSFPEDQREIPTYVQGTDEIYPPECLPLAQAIQGHAVVATPLDIDAFGTRVSLEVWASPLLDETGNPEAAITVYQDITERLKVERELQQYRSRLEDLVDERTQELSAVNQQLLRQRQIAETLRDVATALNSSLDQDTVLPQILDLLRQVIDYDGAAISLAEGPHLVVVGAAGLAGGLIGGKIPLTAQDIMVDVFNSARPRLLADAAAQPAWTSSEDAMSMRGWIGIPMNVENTTIGVLSIGSRQPDAYANVDIGLLEAFASQAAVSVVNTRLYGQAQLTAAAKERERLARDLHDAVTQTLFSASIIAEAIPLQMHSDPASAAQNVEKLRQLTRGALAEMRTLLLELRPAALTEAKLDILLNHLAEAFTGRTRVPVSYTVSSEPGSALPPDVRITFYRVAQEAFNNIMKHARASQVDLDLRYSSDYAILHIDDDGMGFAPGALDETGHMGLSIMRERVNSIDARLDVQSKPGSGVHLSLKWES
jgi:signal transduction histidine kinase